ncbi:MAG: acetyl-coenzyme A synthetase, partial [Sphingomonadaceae bacterium]|nr:acetyl-coenzyme A synthetase [Sphingomonadaceae bacterium]
MSDQNLFPVPQDWAQSSRITAARYQELYAQALSAPEAFWLEQAQRLTWHREPSKAGNWSFNKENFGIKWFEDGQLNASVNCIDRHLPTRADDIAIIWEPDIPSEAPRHISYGELHAEVCRFANVLKAQGVRKGDRVTIYMPMIPEAAFALLACARIGAIHSVVFGGFSPESLVGRIQDCDSSVVVTADEGRRGGKPVALKANVDIAAQSCPSLKSVITVKATGADVSMTPGRDVWYHDEAAKVSADCPAEVMDAEDPLFILYTSGSTGKPKGVLHTTGGYLLWASLTHEWVFDYRPGQIYWCAADIGWVTGHSYILYGPLSNGATTLMYEGVPNWP